ncbi:hypothetical protein CPB84DRAFT_1682556 [Gymnopilus junonius]|uniref:Superkiller protein 3 n=1 Tax=Gymnopilus junonius TaxID=109634 RepID=A0A9P5NMW5_GYMJU|nr:hypothetical protein CPB84DRAFT_1682556 [Gymnopilus junonius]
MSSFARAHLKAARDSISKKDYATAKKEAALVLDFEPENYNAHVFCALALLELGDYNESEQMYRKATELNPTQSLAWQGIANFYERREEWDKQANILTQLLDLFNKNQDVIKCAETLQKLIVLYRKHGSPTQLIAGLSYFLPGSSTYPLLSHLPQPDPTNPTASSTQEAQEAIHNGFHILQEITSLTEKYEGDALNREVEKRRTRLGAPSLEQLKKDVLNEIYAKSQLPSLYNSLLNHPSTSDQLRAEVESKQLRYKQRYLYSIPPTMANLKAQISKELDELVEGIVLLRKRDELAWKLFFETKDCEDVSGYELRHVRDYIRLFPTSSMASLFRGYFAYRQEGLVDEEEDRELLGPIDEDPVDTVINASLSLSDTVLAHRFSAEVYLGECDYENAIKTSKEGLQKLSQLESDTSKNLSRTRIALQAALATSLVNFFPPKHHKEATRIVDEVLTRSPQHISVLMDRAFILEAASEWDAAAKVFDQVSSLLPDDLGLRAKEERAWCTYQLGQVVQGLQGLQDVSEVLTTLEGDEVKRHRARCLWRIGKCYMDIGGPDVKLAYQYFINALKQDSEFAPGFTSLGIYYLEHASPPDPVRSSKCFQKAFELDARESDAAQRLAEGFANDREWDLVEVVAQRTIDGEGGINAGMSKSELDASSRYLPTNAWAWKALGVVKFHYKDYPAAIQAFQIALRVVPDDQSLWVRLGEAYTKAGRHTAALKALAHALELNPDDWLSSYFIADVKQSMGLYDEAIVLLSAIRTSRPDEAGVLASLAQDHLNLGRSEFLEGFQIRAEESFVNGIRVSLDMIQRVHGFRTMSWKFIADACFHLSQFSTFSDEYNVREALKAIIFPPRQGIAEQLEKVVPVPSFQDGASLGVNQVIAMAVHAYLCRIALYSTGQVSNSGAWYDLSVALQYWATKAAPSVDLISIKEKVIEYVKKALQLDASIDLYWVTLGDAYFLSHAKAAQHAYIRALEIDSKNSATWVNLGLLYYYHGDVDLANEALYRAQVLDPDNTRAWVGQFIIATANEDKTDATLLLEHAVGLQTPVVSAFSSFYQAIFHSKKNLERRDQVQDAILPAFFVLNRYCQRRPHDPSGLHLLALVSERLGHYSFGEQLVERAITKLEVAYEETEDPEVERRYAIANATLGRLKFSLGAYAESLTAFESVLGLLAEKETDGLSRALKVQAHLGSGLAHFFKGNLDEALGMFETGLEAAGENLKLRGQVNIVLAQSLWALGPDEAKEAAKTRLLEG